MKKKCNKKFEIMPIGVPIAAKMGNCLSFVQAFYLHDLNTAHIMGDHEGFIDAAEGYDTLLSPIVRYSEGSQRIEGAEYGLSEQDGLLISIPLPKKISEENLSAQITSESKLEVPCLEIILDIKDKWVQQSQMETTYQRRLGRKDLYLIQILNR